MGKGILNWNVTVPQEEEEDDPNWDPDNVIFAVLETDEEAVVSKHRVQQNNKSDRV